MILPGSSDPMPHALCLPRLPRRCKASYWGEIFTLWNASAYSTRAPAATISLGPYASSHPELRKEVPRLNKSGHPDQDEGEANPEGFDLAIAEETEQRVGDKKEPSDWGEQNQCQKVVRATVSH